MLFCRHILHKQRDERFPAPLLPHPVRSVQRHGAPVPAVLVADDLLIRNVEIDDDRAGQRKPKARQRAERLSRTLRELRLRRDGVRRIAARRVLAEDEPAGRRQVQRPFVVAWIYIDHQ